MPWTRAKFDKRKRQPQPIRLRLVINELDTIDPRAAMEHYWRTKLKLRLEQEFEDVIACSGAPADVLEECLDDIYKYKAELKRAQQTITPKKVRKINFLLDPASTWRNFCRLLDKHNVLGCHQEGHWVKERDDELLANIFGYSRPHWRQRRIVLSAVC